MPFPLRVFSLLCDAAVCAVGSTLAQTKDNTVRVKEANLVEGVKGTPVKRTPALTDDSISLLGVGGPGKTTEGAKAGAQVMTPALTAEDVEKKKAEIATLEKQIQEKQIKIEFLMRLFVSDERPFLNDPHATDVEADLQAKRRYEQDELKREAREMAELKARLKTLAAG
jgi:hypothetical protein